MEFIAAITGQYFVLHLGRHAQGITINFEHVGGCNGVFGNVEVLDVAQQKLEGVADTAVAFNHTFQDFV